MELLNVVLPLWRRRALVCIGALVALGAGLLVVQWAGPTAPRSISAVASARMLLDTPDSQLVNVKPRSAETLVMRAMLFADLLATDRARRDIARRAGLEVGQLEVLGPSTRIQPPVSSPLVVEAGAGADVARTPYVLRAYADGLSPMISIEASAPGMRSADRLVEAGRATLESLAAPRDARAGHGFELDVFESRDPVELHAGSRWRIVAVTAVLAVFVLWCAVLVVADQLATRRRAQPV
jgi:hypothetical protein